MIQFIRQTVSQECSKANTLAEMVASYLHDARYFDMDSKAVAVIQCNDGIVQQVPKGWSGNKILVLHDWRPSYRLSTLVAKRIFCIGRFDHPDFGEKCVSVPSFPIDTMKFAGLPTCGEYDAVIGGALREDSCETLKRLLPADIKRVALACHTVIPGTARFYGEIAAFLKSVGVEIAVSGQNFPARVVETLYMSAPAIIHLGHCNRGWLHSVAEYASRKRNVKLFCNEEFGNEKIEDIRDFAKSIGDAAEMPA